MKIPVLDHGYVELIETWGSDERIIEAARMSTDKGFEGWGEEPYYECPVCKYTVSESLVPIEQRSYVAHACHSSLRNELVRVQPPAGDEKLLKYLYTHKHMTPFEMGGLTVKVQAPILVFREWHRHRTQSYNEMSARYTPLPDVNYIPTVERLMMSGGTNKQASSTGAILTRAEAEGFRIVLAAEYARQEACYQAALQAGVPKELARVILPVGRYSRMMASTDLRNWLGFLTLRVATDAQWEIRQFANVVGTLVSDAFPRTWALFSEGK